MVGRVGDESPHTGEPDRKSRRGDVVANRVTGERSVVLVGTGDGEGDRLAVHLCVQPGGAVAGEHFHPSLTERFRVLAGELGVSLDGSKDTLRPGADVTVPAGMVHDWWNAGDEEAQILVDVQPGRRFELMVTTLFGLANEGKTDAKGLPAPLQLAVIAHEFADVIRFTRPPILVQRALFAPLAAIGRARGYRPAYSRYLQPHGREEPNPEMLALVEQAPLPGLYHAGERCGPRLGPSGHRRAAARLRSGRATEDWRNVS